MKLVARILILVTALASTAMAQNLPSYYPVGEKLDYGPIDQVVTAEHRIIIDDSSFVFSADLVVHSPESYSVSRARLRPGRWVTFRVDNNRVITEIWLMPITFDGYR